MNQQWKSSSRRPTIISHVTHLEWIRSLVVEELEEQNIDVSKVDIDSIVESVYNNYADAEDFDCESADIYDIIRNNIAQYVKEHPLESARQ